MMTEQKHTLTLTDTQLEVINAGLQELPMKHSAPVVIEINRQLAAARSAEKKELETN